MTHLVSLRGIALLLVLPLLAGCQQQPSTDPVYENPPPVPSSILPPTPKLSSFDLTDENGQPFNSRSLAGKPWVGSFFFTQCPAVCWRMNQALAKWQSENPDSPIRFISITCDPETDTPEALKRYAEHFKADPQRWTFLTGDMDYITKVGKDMFMLSVTKGGHSSRAMVFDQDGKLSGMFDLLDADQLKKFHAKLAELNAVAPDVTDS